MRKSFFPKKNMIPPHYTSPHNIHILFSHCTLLSKEILPIPKITPENAKNAMQFLKKTWGKRLTMMGIFIAK